MRTIACLCLLVLALPCSASEAKFDPAERTRALAGLIEEETIALAHIDFTRMDPDGLAKTLLALVPARKDELATLEKGMKAFQAAFTKAGGTELVASFSSEELPWISFVWVPLTDRSDVPALTRLLKAHLPQNTLVEKRGSALVAGPREVLTRLAKEKPSARAELPAAIAAAGDTTIQLLLLPTADQRRVIDEVLALPVKSDLTRALTRSLRWAALGIDVGPKPRAALTLQSTDATAARKLTELIGVGIDSLGKVKFLGEDTPLKELLPREFETVAQALKPRVDGSRVMLQLGQPDALRAVTVLADTIVDRTGMPQRSKQRDNLNQILISVINYNDANGTLPPHAIYSKAGKPLLSWRVAVLPYLDENALYREFKLDEPWDSPHNKKLIARMPKVYRSPKIKDPRSGLTTYLAPINKEFIFTGTKEGLRFPQDVPDGTSCTALVVDVNDEAGVIWTKPDDLVVNEKDPWKGLLGHYPGFALFGMADGSVSRIPKNSEGQHDLGSVHRAPAGRCHPIWTGDGGRLQPRCLFRPLEEVQKAILVLLEDPEPIQHLLQLERLGAVPFGLREQSLDALPVGRGYFFLLRRFGDGAFLLAGFLFFVGALHAGKDFAQLLADGPGLLGQFAQVDLDPGHGRKDFQNRQ